MSRLTACPTCGWERFTPHCDEGHTCDLTMCTRCRSFGTVDGRRWVERHDHQKA